jgi:DNA-binding MarR family transcriptional regulator
VERLPFLLRRAAAAIEQLLTETVNGSDLPELTATGVQVLSLLSGSRPTSALAESLRITPQAAGRVVARLEEQGLVCRYPHRFDGRALMVELTPEGEEAAEAIRRAVEDALHVLGDDLEPGRLAALTRDLEVVAEVGQPRHPWDRW